MSHFGRTKTDVTEVPHTIYPKSPHPWLKAKKDKGENENNENTEVTEGLFEEEEDDTPTFKSRFNQRFKRFMIPPGHKRLKMFHLVVSITLYVDFWITSWILGNYLF